MFVGWGRHPLAVILAVAIAYALAHFVLAPAGVDTAGQLAITSGVTALAGAALRIVGNLLRDEEPVRRRNDPPRSGF